MYKSRELFEPYQGFIRGNMYKNLYDGYGPVMEIKPMNEQAELLTYIDILEFGLIDVGMYLDIYPDDEECIRIYNQMRVDKDEFVRKYENSFGPLTMDSDVLEDVPWKWIGPWPWEV